MKSLKSKTIQARTWLNLLFIFISTLLILWSSPIVLNNTKAWSLSSTLSWMASFFPPDLSVLPDLLEGLKESFQMAILATFLSALISIPLSFLMSHLHEQKLLRGLLRQSMNLLRSLPSLLLALLGVVMFGPGPLAGMIALCLYSMGYLVKFFADDMDHLRVGSYLALKSYGAHSTHAFLYGLWPELKKLYFSRLLWMLEYNIRSASIVGLVGAGGLGIRLHIYQEYGQWQRFSCALLLIFVVVASLDFISRQWRQKSRLDP